MSTVAKIVIRTTCGLMVLAAAADCGSAGEAGPYGGEPGGDLGFVGSGGRGVGYGHDAGAGGIADGGVDGSARADGGDGGKSSDGGNGSGSGTGDASNDGGDGNAPDGGSGVDVDFNLPPGFFPSLNWLISGPSGSRSGTVTFGKAQSIEFVAGGIPAGNGYILAISGADIYGDPCSGTSAPFEVFAGQVAQTGIVLTCSAPLTDAAGPANVTTGSVEVDAGVVFRDF